MITDLKQLDLSKCYTYADYLSWQLEEYVELIKGRIVKMSPTPSTAHQRTLGNLFRVIANHLITEKCEVFTAPFDVRLPLPADQVKDDKIDTVVQPDICVICDPAKLDDRGCKGAPDWIIEVLSPGTVHKDTQEKFALYEHVRVKEYWLVHPNDATVLVYRLNDEGIYELLKKTPFSQKDQIEPSVLPGLTVNLSEVFSAP